MPNTVANQRLVTIHRERVEQDFLGIKNENWMAACRDLDYPATILYLYLASNANNYQLALSPAAIQNALDMPRSTYRDQINKLINKGYLVERGGNRYDFYERPQVENAQNIKPRSVTATARYDEECAFAVDDMAVSVNRETGEIIEINNRYDSPNKGTINNEVFDFKNPIVNSERIEGRRLSAWDF